MIRTKFTKILCHENLELYGILNGEGPNSRTTRLRSPEANTSRPNTRHKLIFCVGGVTRHHNHIRFKLPSAHTVPSIFRVLTKTCALTIGQNCAVHVRSRASLVPRPYSQKEGKGSGELGRILGSRSMQSLVLLVAIACDRNRQ